MKLETQRIGSVSRCIRNNNSPGQCGENAHEQWPRFTLLVEQPDSWKHSSICEPGDEKHHHRIAQVCHAALL
jgi:hypothetical protein